MNLGFLKTPGVIAAGIMCLSLASPLFAQAPDSDSPPAAPAPSPSRAPDAMIKAIEQRSVDLDRRAEQLDLKDQRLRMIEQEVSEMLKKDTQLRDEIGQKEKEVHIGQEGQILRLAKMYESMPAEDAAIRMEQMEESLALNLLAKIKEKIAAQILSGMTPAKAAKFSEKLSKKPFEKP